MSSSELFARETAILHDARTMAAREGLPADDYRQALATLAEDYQRMMRESQRLISRSDRAEFELNRLNEQLQALTTALEYKATHDPLTGIYNRGAIIERIQRALDAGPVALTVIDIDHFKRINDAFGHPTGDAVICGLVQRVQNVLDAPASVGRIGGEEFTILHPGADLDQALDLARRIHASLNAQPLEALPQWPVTASFGVNRADRGTPFEELYGRADAALYDAKQQGRNRVVAAPQA